MVYLRKAMIHKIRVYDSPESKTAMLRVIEHCVLFRTTIKDQIQELRVFAFCHKSGFGAYRFAIIFIVINHIL